MTDRTIILPVGHYTGVLHLRTGAPPDYHALRIGRLAITFPEESAFLVWAAAHRPPDHPDEAWTREDVTTAATRLGAADVDQVMGEFFADGILVEVMPAADEAIGFAEHHRVVPLMVGLGNLPEDPLTCGIGLFGMAPVLTVPTLVYDVLQWGSMGASLWEVCLAYAEAGARTDETDDRRRDPGYVLATFLAWSQALVGVNAAYIDEATRAE